MAIPKKFDDQSQEEQILQASSAAMEEVLAKSTYDALMNVTPTDLIHPDPDSEVIKGTAKRAGGWMHGPALWQSFAAADQRLTRCAKMAGMMVRQVERVHARLIKGTKLLVLQPAPDTDLSAISVARYAGTSGAWINLITLLGPAGLTVDTGYRERYDVAYVPKGSPLWPGLVIDLGKAQERRLEPVAKKTEKEAAKPEKPAAQPAAQPAKAAGPETK